MDVYGEYKEQTPAREQYVVTIMVQKWLAQGLTASQIALRWNAGGAAHCSSGINSHGVKYDSCAHVEKVMAYLQN